MTLPAVASLLWLLSANIIAMLPTRDHHWTSAYILIAIGIPLSGWVSVVHGPIWTLLFLAGAASVLRWPMIYLGRWVRAAMGRQNQAE